MHKVFKKKKLVVVTSHTIARTDVKTELQYLLKLNVGRRIS